MKSNILLALFASLPWHRQRLQKRLLRVSCSSRCRSLGSADLMTGDQLHMQGADQVTVNLLFATWRQVGYACIGWPLFAHLRRTCACTCTVSCCFCACWKNENVIRILGLRMKPKEKPMNRRRRVNGSVAVFLWVSTTRNTNKSVINVFKSTLFFLPWDNTHYICASRVTIKAKHIRHIHHCIHGTDISLRENIVYMNAAAQIHCRERKEFLFKVKDK